MASGVFGLKKVYKRQVENINNGNFASWTEDFTHGYLLAGRKPASPQGSGTQTIVRYDYNIDTGAELGSSSNLPALSAYMDGAAVSNSNYGYYSGGATPSVTSTIVRLDFSTEINSLPGAYLPTNVDRHASVSRDNEGYGYFIGGQNPAIVVAPKQISTITRLDFASETVSPMPNLPTATEYLRGFNGTTYGYALGGQAWSGGNVTVNTIYRLDFSSNTLAVSLSSKNLIAVRRQFIANESILYGYASAGNPNLSTIERLDFFTENTTTLNTVTSNSGTNGTGFSSLLNGYIMGVSDTATTDQLNFSNETISSSPLADSNSYRCQSASVSARHKQYNRNSGTVAYVNQGSNNNNVDKFSYQTETWNANIFNASDKHGQTGGASSGLYGYIFGGKPGTGQTSVITRIDFSNETNSVGGKGGKGTLFYLPSSVSSLQDAGVTQSNSYAYYVGGNNNQSSSIFRMDFFTENFDRSRSSLPTNRNTFSSVKSADAGYLTTDGTSTVYRLNFSNETLSSSLNYPISITRTTEGYAYSSQYGYFLGGQNSLLTPNVVSYIYRLNFSNDTFSLLNQNAPGIKNTRGGCSSGDRAAYLNCLQDNGASTVHRLEFSTEVLTQLAPSPANRADSVAITNANT